MDATTLTTLCPRDEAANTRVTLSPLAHFVTPIPPVGIVFVATHDSLVVYRLLSELSVGKSYSVAVASGPALPLRTQAGECVPITVRRLYVAI